MLPSWPIHQGGMPRNVSPISMNLWAVGENYAHATDCAMPYSWNHRLFHSILAVMPMQGHDFLWVKHMYFP